MTFPLPDYDQIPNVGLYLEPLGCTPLTGSMISNLKSSHNNIKKVGVFRPFAFGRSGKARTAGFAPEKQHTFAEITGQSYTFVTSFSLYYLTEGS